MKKIIFLTIYIVVSLFLVWGCAIFLEWDVCIAGWTIEERGWIIFGWSAIILFSPLILIESDEI